MDGDTPFINAASASCAPGPVRCRNGRWIQLLALFHITISQSDSAELSRGGESAALCHRSRGGPGVSSFSAPFS
jgi:hypothetical protein